MFNVSFAMLDARGRKNHKNQQPHFTVWVSPPAVIFLQQPIKCAHRPR